MVKRNGARNPAGRRKAGARSGGLTRDANLVAGERSVADEGLLGLRVLVSIQRSHIKRRNAAVRASRRKNFAFRSSQRHGELAGSDAKNWPVDYRITERMAITRCRPRAYDLTP